MTDFFKAIENAQKVPEAPDSDNPIPDMLSGAAFEKFINTAADSVIGKIPGVVEYQLEYRSARLTIGQRMTGFENGQAVFEDVDESARLKEIMDMSLSGRAIILKKLESFLKDGTMVIWLEYTEQKAAPAKKDRDYLTTPELFSPFSEKDDEDSDSDTEDDDDD